MAKSNKTKSVSKPETAKTKKETKSSSYYWERPKLEYEQKQEKWMEGSKREFRKNFIAQFHLKDPASKGEVKYNKKQEEWRKEWVKYQLEHKKKFVDVQKSSEVFRPKKKFFIITCVCIIVVIAILLTIGAFFDKQITSGLSEWRLPSVTTSSYYDAAYEAGKITLRVPDGSGSMANHLGQVYTNSIFAEVIEIIGVAPTTLITIFALGIIFWNSFRLRSKGGRAAVQTISIVLTFFWFWFTGFFTYFPQFVIATVGLEKYAPYGPTKDTGTALIFVFASLIIGGILGFAIFAGLKFVKYEIMCELLRWAMIVSSAALCSIIVMEVLLKPVLCRERWRFIYAFSQVDNLVFYDPVTGLDIPEKTYIGNAAVMDYNLKTFGGFKDWFNLPVAATPYVGGNTPFLSEDITKSFPSGHQTMASCGILSLLILPHTVRACNTKKWKQTIWSIVPPLLVIFGLGRLVAGAHYLSDVTFGMIISGGFLLIFYAMNTWSTRWLDQGCGIQISAYKDYEVRALQKKIEKKNIKAQQAR